MEDWLIEANKRLQKMPEEAKQIRTTAMENLHFFAQLLNPLRVYGDLHKEVFDWLQLDEGGNQLLLLPRGHMKSHCLAVWCAWWITNHPESTILYISATAELAEKQLYDIKNILTSDTYRRYWPDMLNPEEGRREKWAVSKFAVDHPRRRMEGIRDWTVATAGLTTNTTGWHADVILADDVVVPDNAYTEEGRKRVSNAMSQMTSIRNAGGFTKAAGTRYHPSDIYATWKEQKMAVYDDETNELIDTKLVWDIKEHVVESDGFYLWPRAIREDGKAFGFSQNILARIRAEYEDTTQFFAQYYNNPNDPGSNRISRDRFQYYDQRNIKRVGGDWFYKDKRLNVYAAIDFAFSLSTKADYSAIVVIGIDSDANIYILDIDRFKTNKTIDYFKRVAELHSKWEFRKLRAEVTVAQQIIVNDLKEYAKNEGLRLSIDPYRPTRNEGTKEERIASALEHRYDNLKMWHFRGGHILSLEEELVLSKPPHDDIKDALASAVEIAIKPKQSSSGVDFGVPRVATNSRFGGVSYRG